MGQNRVQNAVRGIGAGVINNILTVLLPFVTRTVIIYTLGIQYAGLSSLFSSVISILNISELGIGSAISYSMYRPLQEGDDAKVCALLAFYCKCYRIIGVLTLLVGLVFLPFLDKLVAGDYPPNINLYILYLVYLFNNVLGYFLFAYKKVILSANQRYDVEVNISSICTIMQNILQIFLLLLVRNYYMYVIVIPFITLVGNIISSCIAGKMFPQFFCYGKIEWEQLRDILRNVGGIVCTKVSSTVFLSVDNIIVSAFLGLTVLAVYGNYYYVISCLLGIFAVIHNSIRPVVGNCLITDSREKLYENFTTYQFLYMWFAAWATTCLICMYQNFEYLWGGSDNILPIKVVLLLVVSFYIGKMGALQEVYLEAAGIYWERKYIPLIAAALNLTLNIILVQRIGLYGVIFSTLISHVFITTPCNAYMAKKYCFYDLLSLPRYFSECMSQLLVCLLCCITTYKVCSVLGETSIWNLVCRGGICLVLPNLIYLICFIRGKRIKNAFALLHSVIKG